LEPNAEAVLTICRYVEGLPLGLELAASWLRVMSAAQIAVEPKHSLDLLSLPARNSLERHRSLRAVFDHSWKLLTPDEQVVFRKLAVFRGGFEREAAEQVANASLQTLAALVDKSLLRTNAAGRYDLHELLRQFAADKLVEAGATAAVARCHLDYFVELAERAETYLYGPYQEDWFDRLEMEQDNLNAALDWSLKDEKIEMGLHLACALSFFWDLRSHDDLAYSWMKKFVARFNDVPVAIRVKAWRVAGKWAGGTGHDDDAKPYCDESLRLARAIGDKADIAWALSDLAFYTNANNDDGRACLEQALALFREIGDEFGTSHALRRLAWYIIDRGDYERDYERAITLLEESLALARAAQDKNATAWSLGLLAKAIWLQRHDPLQTWSLATESLALAQQAHDPALIALVLFYLGQATQARGDYLAAKRHYTESLAAFLEIGDKYAIPKTLLGFGKLARAQAQPERAARLLGAASATAPNMPMFLNAFKVADDIRVLRAQLGDAPFERLWAEGCAMTPDQAIAYALEK
jgi:tetratricopeptide (TPR) repeat protein